MEDIRFRVRAIILGIASVIVTILFLRILLELLNANTSSGLVMFIYNLSDIFIAPFKNTVDLPPFPGVDTASRIDVDALFAIAVYILGAIALSEILTAFLFETFTDVVQNFVDAIFKVIEFLLFIRIILDLFAIFDRSTSPGFIKFIFQATDWTQGIIQSVKILGGSLNLSAVIVLIIIVVIDLLTERFLASLFTNLGLTAKTINITKVVSYIPIPGRKKSE